MKSQHVSRSNPGKTGVGTPITTQSSLPTLPKSLTTPRRTHAIACNYAGILHHTTSSLTLHTHPPKPIMPFFAFFAASREPNPLLPPHITPPNPPGTPTRSPSTTRL